jgi:hypothetical protein
MSHKSLSPDSFDDVVARAGRLLVEHATANASNRSGVDAIVVPTARGVDHLHDAISLANATGAFLLAVCSRGSRARQLAAALPRTGQERWMVIDLAEGCSHPLLSMASDRIPQALWGAAGTDLAIKRNIGLLIAHLVGWRSVMFLDDDIRDLNPAHVQTGAGLLDRHDLVGFRVTEFPDNSVVRHVRRLTGAGQHVFISGAALEINDAATRGFFPTIYNEDWLFMLPSLEVGPAAMIGTVSQLPYDPFDPARAAREEFGDLLAEGLLRLLLTTGSTIPQPPAWWEQAMAARDRLLDELLARLGDQHPSATVAVHAAKTRLHQIPPIALADYTTTWRADLSIWERRLASLPTTMSPIAAARQLQLNTVARE